MIIKANISGQASLTRQLKKLGDKAFNNMNTFSRDKCNEIAADARVRCKDSVIRGEITTVQTKDGFAVRTFTKFSAYLEFGTGMYAEALLSGYPKEWQDMAWQFFVNGLGRTAAMPYLYPAYTSKTTNVTKEIESIIWK